MYGDKTCPLESVKIDELHMNLKSLKIEGELVWQP